MRNKLIIIGFFFAAFSITLNSCQSEQQLDYARYYTAGKQLYEVHCQNCHSSTGAGLGQLIPPLTDSVFLKQNKSKISCIIKNGALGKVNIHGKSFEGQMPGNTQLADIEIAELVTYITNSFGNKQGLFSVANAESDLKVCD